MTAASGAAGSTASVAGHGAAKAASVGHAGSSASVGVHLPGPMVGYAGSKATVAGVAGTPPPPPPGQCASNYQPFACPDVSNIVKLWPRGRAWPIRHDPSTYPRYLEWLATFPKGTVPTTWPAGFVQAGYTKTLIDVFGYAVARLCALREEFWCATQIEDRDLWMQEYGLPDPCDPFPDLCTKVAALGGQTCAYFQQVGAWAGWDIECVEELLACGATCGCDMAGSAQTGGAKGNVMKLVVNLPDSPAYHAYPHQIAYAGCAQAGGALGCGPLNIVPLQCLMERIAPAHVLIDYEIAQ